ncbi:DUF2079 domain-containing protein [bacterium]|nr:DUF2079 domain-containing protein [bacterium]
MPARRFSASAWAGLLLGAALFAVLAGACLIQYRAFGYNDFDLAVHVQSIWNLLRGSLDCSILGMPWPGNHANWILVLIAPVFALAPSPLTLLVIQSAALALGAWPVWLLARREFESDRWAWVFVAAYALYPALAHLGLYEFHPVALATPMLLAAFYCARIQRDGWLVFWSVLAATCQENIPLVVIALCVYRLAFRPRPWWACGTLAVGMLVWFILCIGVIGPHFNRGENVGWLNLYGQFGQSGGEVARNLVLRPDLVWQTLWQPNRGDYLLRVLGPVLLLPLAAPEVLIVALPSFAQHLLSQRVSEQSVVFHYTATIIPLVMAAMVIGAARVWRMTGEEGTRAARWHPWIASALLAGLLGVAAATQWQFGLPYRVRRLGPQYQRTELAVAKERALESIPPDASVITTFDLLARAARRRECRPLSMVVGGRKVLSAAAVGPVPPADWVLVDFAEPLTFGGLYHAGQDLPAGARLPPSEQLLRRYFASADWECVSWVNSFAVFRRMAGGSAATITNPAASDLLWQPVARLTLRDGPVLEVARARAPAGSLTFQFEWRQPESGAASIQYWTRLDVRGSGPEARVVATVRRGPVQLWGQASETWDVRLPELPAGEYTGELVLYDRQAYAVARATGDPATVSRFAPAAVVPVGKITVPGR